MHPSAAAFMIKLTLALKVIPPLKFCRTFLLSIFKWVDMSC